MELSSSVGLSGDWRPVTRDDSPAHYQAMNKLQSLPTKFGAPPLPEDRRREPRYASDGLCELTLLSQTSAPFQGRIVDASRSGLRIETPRQIEVDSRLRVHLGTSVVFAAARWCRWSHDDIWEVGVKIDHMISRTLVESLRNGARDANFKIKVS